MEEVMARGPNFIYAKDFIQKQYGEETWQKLLDSLPNDVAEVWNGQILTHSTYPFLAFKEMVSALSRELGMLKNAETAKLYEYIADCSLNKIYKLFFKFANPSFVISNYPKLWDRFFTAGKVEVPTAEKGHATVKFTLPEIFLDWLSPACMGYSKKAIEMSGGKNLTMRQNNKTRLPDDLWEVEYNLTWDE